MGGTTRRTHTSRSVCKAQNASTLLARKFTGDRADQTATLGNHRPACPCPRTCGGTKGNSGPRSLWHPTDMFPGNLLRSSPQPRET